MAVSQNGLALEHASVELKGDREVVMGAVFQSGQALEHASEELRSDRLSAPKSRRCLRFAIAMPIADPEIPWPSFVFLSEKSARP